MGEPWPNTGPIGSEGQEGGSCAAYSRLAREVKRVIEI